MNLSYKVFCFSSFLFLSSFLFSASAQDVVAKNFSDQANGTLYDDAYLSITYSGDNDFIARNYLGECLPGIASPFNAFILKGLGNYVDITRKPGCPKITKVQYVALSVNSGATSAVICSASLDGTNFLNEDYNSDVDWEETISRAFTFGFNAGDICGQPRIFEIPDVMYEYGDTTPITDIRDQVQIIRLMRSNNWAGHSLTNPNDTELYLINVWFEEDTPTGVEAEGLAELTIRREGDDFLLNQGADIAVYSMNGSKVIDLGGVYSFSLSGHDRGVYIVRAKTENGVTTQKLIY